MELNSAEAIFYTLCFLVPGFIWRSVLERIIPVRSRKKQNAFLEYFALSSLNFGIWSFLIFYMMNSGFTDQHQVIAAILGFTFIFVSPVFLGVLHGSLERWSWARNKLSNIGIPFSSAIPTSWDFVFNSNKKAWIIITLDDYSTVAGRFGKHSFASDEPGNRDLFVEEVWIQDSESQWTKPERKRGAWINASSIRAIEFIYRSEDDDNGVTS